MSSGFYYGWYIAAAMMVVNFASQATGRLNLGLFIIPMANELRISRSSFGLLTTFRSLAGGVSGIFLGRLLDRYGPRLIIPSAALITGLCLIGISTSTNMFQFILLFALIGLAGFGNQNLMMLTQVPVAKWFIQKRGRALSLATLGLGIGASAFMLITQWFITKVGWRRAWVLLAFISMALIIPISLALLRRRPEDLGLFPDGNPGTPQKSGAEPDSEVKEADWSVSEALGTRSFWLLTLAGVLFGFGMGGSVHRIPYFMELGFNPQLVSLAFSIDAAGATLMILVSGFLAERIRGSFISAGSFAGFALAVCLMLSASDAWQMFASVLLFGSAVGISMVIQNHLWASYFGRAFLGTIRGITMPAMLLSTALGAPVVGYIYDLTGSYGLGWQLLIAVYIGGFVVMLCARPPCRLRERKLS